MSEINAVVGQVETLISGHFVFEYCFDVRSATL
jgi:hypothetical protein